MKVTHDYALKYFNAGFSVIPLYSNQLIKDNEFFREDFENKLNDKFKKAEKKNGTALSKNDRQEIARELLTYESKRAIVIWKQYREQRATEQDLTNWFKDDWPLANIGIITGKLSNIFVLDVDGETGEKYITENGGVPDTPTVLTGKGRHLFFRYPKNIEIKNSTNTDLKLDIRGEGGYVVAPPSIHGSKKDYRWEDGLSIFDIEIAEAPKWVIQFATRPKEKKKPSKKKNNSPADRNGKVQPAPDPAKDFEPNFMEFQDIPDPIDTSSSSPSILDLIENGSAEGSRNDSATRILGHWLNKRLSNDEVWALFQMWNLKNRPPMDDDELLKIFNSISASDAESKQSETIDITDFQVSVDDIINNFNAVECNRLKFGNDNLSILEENMSGGLVGGNLYLLGGIPSSGKTALINNIADNLCLNDNPVIIFSYDDGDKELINRTISRFSPVNIEELNQGNLPEDRLKLIDGDSQLKKILTFKHIVSRSIIVEKWQEMVDSVFEKFGKKPIIFIDYLKKVQAKYSKKEERLRMDANINAITDLAKFNDIPIIAISELNRESYKAGHILSMSAFKETGALEYEASWLAIMAPVEEDKDGELMVLSGRSQNIKNGLVSLVILKTKRGTGRKGKIPLSLNSKTMKFSSDFNVQSKSEKTTKNKSFA